jgi:hypothetical protein
MYVNNATSALTISPYHGSTDPGTRVATKNQGQGQVFRIADNGSNQICTLNEVIFLFHFVPWRRHTVDIASATGTEGSFF